MIGVVGVVKYIDSIDNTGYYKVDLGTGKFEKVFTSEIEQNINTMTDFLKYSSWVSRKLDIGFHNYWLYFKGKVYDITRMPYQWDFYYDGWYRCIRLSNNFRGNWFLSLSLKSGTVNNRADIPYHKCSIDDFIRNCC